MIKKQKYLAPECESTEVKIQSPLLSSILLETMGAIESGTVDDWDVIL